MSMIIVVGNTHPEILIEDLNVRVLFRDQVQFTPSQYHRSPDLQRAILESGVRVIYGISTPQVIKQPQASGQAQPTPAPTVAEGVARGHDPQAPLQELVDLQRAQLEAQQQQIELLTAQAAQMGRMEQLLEGLKQAPIQLAPLAVTSFPVAERPSARPDPVFIPAIKPADVQDGQVLVEERAGGDVSKAIQALKNKRNR
jgi:hypothetical protein